MANRASKGSAFERDICRRLSLWWTQDSPEPRDDVFWRTSTSGARATMRSRKGKSTYGSYGDICAVDPIGQPLLDLMVFELKRGYNRLSIQDLLDRRGAGELDRWIEQARASQKAAGSDGWAIIWKRDQRSPLVLLSFPFYVVSMMAAFDAVALIALDAKVRLGAVTLDEFLTHGNLLNVRRKR